MLASAFLTRLNYALRGTDDDAPTWGSDEANYWIDTFNRIKNGLYEDVGKNWSSAYEVRSLGTVSASAAPTYNLPTDFIAPSGDNSNTSEAGGGVYVITTGNQRVNIPLTHAQERNPYVREAFIAGQNPQKLYITDPITAAENIIGGTLYIPGYFMPADVDAEDDVIPVPDPNWGVMATAAEIAFSDIVYEDKAPDINAKANDLYSKMVIKERRGTYRRPRVTPSALRRIRGTSR